MATEKVVEVIAEAIPGRLDLDRILAPDLIATEVSRHDVYVTESKTGKTVAKTRLSIETPDQLSDPVGLLWVPGYAGIKPAYRHAREGSAQEGRISGTWRPIKDLSLLETFRPVNLRHPEVLPVRTLESVIAAMCEFTEQDQVDLVCHSMGGFIATLVAARDTEAIRNIILVASAGLEDHNLWTLAKRTPNFIRNEFLPHFKTLREENEARMALEALDYVFRNPLRTVAEGIAVGNCNIRNQLRTVKESGTMIGGLLFASDQLFIEQNIRDQAGDCFHILETFDDLEAGHMGPQLQSYAVARHAVGLCARLNLASNTLERPLLRVVHD